ncbi:hypothetical protein ACTZWT_18850 [Rhodopseudomonas sp. NSM]|uniref:hypothetical protein n=1 Tax=Rhodopseudomonas sp. NSM TaxID=3457630 RepID=UPI004035C418
MDEVPETTMASEVGQIPVDGGDFLPFLLEYRRIIEDGGGSLTDLASRHPQYRDLLFRPQGDEACSAKTLDLNSQPRVDAGPS